MSEMVERVARIICGCPDDWYGNEEHWKTRASAAIAAIRDWQPIETAPKDGREIIGWEKSEGTFLVAYRPDLSENTSYVWFNLEGLWPHCPTDWMPLPEPPS